MQVILGLAVAFFWLAGVAALLAGNYGEALDGILLGAVCLMLGILSARVKDLENKR